MQIITESNRPSLQLNQNHWQSQLRTALKTYPETRSFFELKEDFESKYNNFIPLKLAHKIKQAGPSSPLWKQFIPVADENDEIGFHDPIGDLASAKGNGIIHRYESRILFTPTTFCPVICRYCFRKNQLSEHDPIFKTNFIELKKYLIQNPQVNEVILTGGDPLMLNNNKLIELFEMLSFQNIKFLRIHTRTPIILPERINEGFIKLLQNFSSKFTKIIFVLHTNHADELDQDVSLALNKLRQAPIKKLTQSVLLHEVNNSSQDLENLFYKVLDCDFTPYYLHHPDKAKGAMHFWLPLEEGRRIYAKIRDKLPGWAIPHYTIDHPSGDGKQHTFNPESFSFSGKLLNKDGDLLTY